jgi:hypothetical protein
MSDDWDFYQLTVDYKPASIMVDLGIRNDAPVATHPFMTYLRLYMPNPRDDGLSSDTDFENLSLFEGAMEDATRSSDHHYVGRNTSDGVRDFYFYTRDPHSLHRSITDLMARYPDYQYETDHRDDGEWDAYCNFLYPSARSMQQIWNRRLLGQLEASGDAIDQPRTINHFVYFQSAAELSVFATALERDGFTISERGKLNPDSDELAIHFHRDDAPTQMNNVVGSIFGHIGDLDADYDGWGCEVTKAS